MAKTVWWHVPAPEIILSSNLSFGSNARHILLTGTGMTNVGGMHSELSVSPFGLFTSNVLLPAVKQYLGLGAAAPRL